MRKTNQEKLFDSITFKDDMMFKSVMQDPDICKEVLELLLGFKLRKIAYPEKEYELRYGIIAHSVRLDLYVEDENGRMIDIEMQNAPETDLARRARYYQGMMDASCLQKGMNYADLPDVYVIFLCDFNPFGGKERVYRFRMMSDSNKPIPLNNGVEHIFACTKGENGETPIEILQFLSYLKDNKPTNRLTEKIENKVLFWKKNEGWRKIYMENHAREMDLTRAGEKAGRIAGEKAGRIAGEKAGRIAGEKVGRIAGEKAASERFAIEEARFGKLMEILFQQGKQELVRQAYGDKQLRKKLYEEYGID